jgi:PPM family protein phosphatase
VNEPIANYFFRTETNQRSNNEDSLDRSELTIAGESPITLLSLADGMGGYEHGEEISRAGLQQFKQALRGKLNAVETAPPLTVEKLQQALIGALQQTNIQIRQTIATNNWHKAGSTIVVAAIWQNRLVAINLGDSPLFHHETATGKLVKLTLDHSVVGILTQAGIITEEMARHHDRRGQLEYYLGCPQIPTPLPVYERELRSGDVVMLCSDGISGLLSLAQIEQILARTETSLERKAEELIHAARAVGETDNQTIMLWSYQHSNALRLRYPVHNQPLRPQDSSTIDATSPRGREIDAAIDRQTLAPPSAPATPSPPRKRSPFARAVLLWATCGSVITLAALTVAGWDTTGNIIKFLPKQVEGLLDRSPKSVPTALPQKLPPTRPKPKKLPPDRDPSEIIQNHKDLK